MKDLSSKKYQQEWLSQNPPPDKPRKWGGARVSSGSDSKQDYETPWPLIYAVETLIGEKFAFDMAASESNKKAPLYFSEKQNSLNIDWRTQCATNLSWLNPPFSLCTEFAEKCHKESLLGWRGVMFTPASVDANWWRNHVHHIAWVKFVSPRIQFIGAKDPYPKPLSLSFYNIPFREWYEPWRWKP